jgi:WD40 repeat protein
MPTADTGQQKGRLKCAAISIIYNTLLDAKTKSTAAYPFFDSDDYQTMGKRILCGKFAERLKNNFAVGDEDNNLILYNLVSPKPIAVLNPAINSNISALTSLTFTRSDEQVIVGSSRGSINVWDLNTLKSTIS